MNARRILLFVVLAGFLTTAAGCGRDGDGVIRVWADKDLKGVLPRQIDGHRLTVTYINAGTQYDQYKDPDVVLTDDSRLQLLKPYVTDLTDKTPVARDEVIVARRKPGTPPPPATASHVAITIQDAAAILRNDLHAGAMSDVQLFDTSEHALDYIRTRPRWSAFMLRSVLRRDPDAKKFNVRTPGTAVRTFQTEISKRQADDGTLVTKWLVGDQGRARFRVAGLEPIDQP